MTTISRVPLPEAELRALAGELGRACGSEASVVSGVIQIRGDHQTVVARALEGRGYTVELD
jgi:translation initiation factor 1